jgi:hypothetical protein
VTGASDRETVSPELVLVDPELAAWARERLEERRVPPISADPAPPPVATPRPGAPDTGGDGDSPAVPARRSRPRRRRGRVLIAAVVGLAVVVAAALVVDSDAPGVSGPAGGRPALALEDEPTSPPAPKPPPPPPAPNTKPPPPPPAPPASPSGKAATIATPHRFAWAPRPGASGYHVELFRGNALVFRATTSKPEIVIPRRWRLNGRPQRLAPGAYRWYVWAQVGGRREGKATVQAKLVLPTR